MTFFFIRDTRQKYRFFSSEPFRPLRSDFSKSRQAWETAKRRLNLLPMRILRQEQAFEGMPKTGGSPLKVVHSGCLEEKKVRLRFFFFLEKQKTRHTLLLVGEALVLPLTGFLMPFPGPNLAFYVLAIAMITQWQALKGINRSLKKDFEFVADPLFGEWETAVREGREARYAEILNRIESVHGLEKIQKVLVR